MTGYAIRSSSGLWSWSFAMSPSITDAAAISPIFIASPSRLCRGIRGTRSAFGPRPPCGPRGLGGFRRTRIREGAPRQASLGAEHQVLVCEHVAERVELAVLRDPDEDMTAFLAHGDEALHERELLRELGQGAVDRDDRALDLVREVDRELPLDEPAVLVHHVPRLVFERALRKFA